MQLTIDGRSSYDEVHGLKNKQKFLCPTCDARTVFKSGNSMIKVSHRGRSASANVPSRRCVECGHRLVEGSDVTVFRLTALSHLLKAEVHDPELFNAVRAALNLQNNNLAAILSIRRTDIWRVLEGKDQLTPGHWKSLTTSVSDRLRDATKAHHVIKVILAHEQNAA